MKKVFGVALILLPVLLCVAAYRFVIYAIDKDSHISARPLVICVTLFIIGLIYLLRWGIRLLK